MSNPSPSTQATSLAQTNSAALGASFPVVTLPDGSQVSTGTVGALLVHIRQYNASSDAVEKKELEARIRAAVPVLQKVGFFDLFAPEEWMSAEGKGASEGRTIVGKVAKEMGL